MDDNNHYFVSNAVLYLFKFRLGSKSYKYISEANESIEVA